MSKGNFILDFEYFISLLANGDKKLFDKEYRKCFDFRDPKTKRKNKKDYTSYKYRVYYIND